MSSLTIYTLGDIPTFTGVLNAVAMVFQSGAFTGPGIGLGAAVGLGLLVSLGVLLLVGGAIAMFQGGGAGPGNWAMLLVLILVYSVATQKVDLQIEDYYTGTATTVANVPFGVAVPGAIISSITRSVADKMEVGFSTVDGNYISLSSDGFASPLQLMLSMRGGKYALPDADPFLAANIKVFVLDCVAGRPGFSPNAFAKQNIPGVNNPIAYITTPGVYGGGLTVIFSDADPAGIGSACADAATNIKNKMDAFVGPGINSAMSAFINANMNKRASPNTATPNKYTADDIVDVHGKMINGIWGASQTAQDFMITALTSGTISNAYNCGLSNSSYATYNQCTMTMTQSMEQWKIDAAGGATGFSKAMMPAMNILLAMFFGFAPLMFVFMMMAGAQGLGILVKYMFFGIWCQTWLPFAVVINYIGEVMVKSEFLRLAAAAPNGLNPATVPAFYDALSVKLAVISDMLAAVPLISMALMSGSIYGLTKIASNMGKDKVDEKGAAPGVQETAPLMRTAPVGSQNEARSVMNPHTRGETAGGSTLPSLSVGATAQQARANAEKSAVAASTAYGQAVKSTVASTYGTTDQDQAMRSFGREIGSSREEGDQWISDRARAASEKVTLTQEQSDALKGIAGASVGISLGALGAKGGIEYARTALAKKSWAKGIDLTSMIKEAQSVGTKDTLSASFQSGNSHSHTAMRALQHGSTDELSRAENLVESAGREASITSALSRSVGLTQGKPVDQWSGDIVRMGRNAELASAVSRRGLRAEAKHFRNELRSMGMKTEAQIEVAGNLLALANSGSTGANGDAIYAMTGDATMRNMPEISSPNTTAVAPERVTAFKGDVDAGIVKGQAAANRAVPNSVPSSRSPQQVHDARGGGEAPGLGVLQNRQDPGTIYNSAPINQIQRPWDGLDDIPK
ncbi:conjugal transfer protein TraG N-terminal domain-containing protein [Candidatus Ferrigenium straubiae]|jgi:conjugal transfer mating pair stabilization protein TraG|uniref:conjugal transfer protein TraG N-terminal domain-containing protein n=1 Tax=Candidatus Ferrigenium straubiae TaxID=2919506 RepID=UPI003F4ABBDA